MSKSTFLLSKLTERPLLGSLWSESLAQTLSITNVHEASSSHHPKTELKLGYTDEGLFGNFLVSDCYVRSTAEKFQDCVCVDSCVEAFLQPGDIEDGYLNFEINCGGTLLVSWVKKVWFENGSRMMDTYPLTLDDIEGVEIASSLPKINDPEITKPLEWSLDFFIPFIVFERVGPWAKPTKDSIWHGNFYKCGDNTSHPHWISWAPIKELNFHAPQYFGEVKFS